MRRKWEHLLDKFRYLWYLLQYAAALMLCPFLKRDPRYRDLWIIAERGTDARDNASHLFRYIRQNHPQINICYIISRDSPDRPAMEALGRVVDYRSFAHYLAFAAARMKISTHIMGFSPEMWLFKKVDEYFTIPGAKIFLQHGVIKDDLPYLYGDRTRLDLFVCGAKREWEYVNTTFRYPEGVVRYLGLCRFDKLASQPRGNEKVLLLMPTWRSYIQDGVFTDQHFMQTDYYRSFQSLLTSPRLAQLLEDHGYRLKFYPHHEVLRYLHCFRVAGERVEIVDPKKLGVQQALIEADALLTDYSSVFFDFGYMMKPVLHYQFDQEQFRRHHYQEGYFSYERDGFGPVCTEEDQLLDALAHLLAGQCRVEEPYRSRIEGFFYVRDSENCRRNFQAIEEIWKRDYEN